MQKENTNRPKPAKNVVLPVKGAIYNGLFSPTVDDLAVSCPTGNCTWPVVPYLAICGGCTNTTHLIKSDCASSQCLYTLPSGLSIASLGSEVLNISVVESPLIYHQPNVPYLTVFDYLGAEPGSGTFQLSGVPLVAAECALSFCVQAQNISVRNGRQSRHLVGMWNSIAPRDAANSTADYIFTSPPKTMNVSPESTFSVNGLAVQAMISELSSKFTGRVSADIGENSYSSDTIAALWGSKNVSVLVDNLALSLTNDIRLTPPREQLGGAALGPTAGEIYDGTAHSSVAYVHVNWWWLILPLVLLLSTLVFFVSVVVQSRKAKVEIWKSSTLAAMLSPLDSRLLEKFDGLAFRDKEEAAKETKVSLVKGGAGWKFRGHDWE
jgi:hypothetical protein